MNKLIAYTSNMLVAQDSQIFSYKTPDCSPSPLLICTLGKYPTLTIP